MNVNYIPEGFHTLTPYLHVQELQNLVGFLVHAFGATILDDSRLPDGTIINAKLQIGDSVIEMSEVRGDFKPMPCAIHFYVEDVDTVFKKAVEVGAQPVMEPSNLFYGDREAFVLDPCGNHWYIATRIENVSKEEIQQRINEFVKETSENKQA